jgi:hypothetical protein
MVVDDKDHSNYPDFKVIKVIDKFGIELELL